MVFYENPLIELEKELVEHLNQTNKETFVESNDTSLSFSTPTNSDFRRKTEEHFGLGNGDLDTSETLNITQFRL